MRKFFILSSQRSGTTWFCEKLAGMFGRWGESKGKKIHWWEEVLPPEERWSAKKFNLSEVFSQLGSPTVTHDLSYYYDVTSFEGYKRWAASKIKISKPPVEKWITPSRYKKSLLEFE